MITTATSLSTQQIRTSTHDLKREDIVSLLNTAFENANCKTVIVDNSETSSTGTRNICTRSHLQISPSDRKTISITWNVHKNQPLSDDVLNRLGLDKMFNDLIRDTSNATLKIEGLDENTLKALLNTKFTLTNIADERYRHMVVFHYIDPSESTTLNLTFPGISKGTYQISFS